MDRYEFTEGGSAKFWEAGVEGATLTVRFGRVGTAGQTKDKLFADAAAADRELKKLVREKTGKGYAPVGAAAAAPAAPASPSTATADPEPTPSAPTPPAPDEAPSEAPTDTTRPAQPSAGRPVAGTPLPTRTRPGPPLDAAADWAAYRRIMRDEVLPGAERNRHNLETQHNYARDWRPEIAGFGDPFAFVAARLGEVPPAAVDLAVAREWARHVEVLHESLGAVRLPSGGWRANYRRDGMVHFARWLVAAQGAALAVETAASLRPTAPRYLASAWAYGSVIAWRSGIVAAPAEDYDRAVAAAEVLAAASTDARAEAFLAFLLADDRPEPGSFAPAAVLGRALARGAAADAEWLTPLIADSRPSAVARERAAAGSPFSRAWGGLEPDEAAATVVAVAESCGESAAPALRWLFDGALLDARATCASALLAQGGPGACDVLLPLAGDRWVRAALDAAAEADPAGTFRMCLSAVGRRGMPPALEARVWQIVARHGADAARGWARELGADDRARLERMLAEGAPTDAAPREDWPAVLRDPPWRGVKRATADDIVLDLAPVPIAPTQSRDPAAENDYWRGRHGEALASLDALPAFIADAEAKAAADPFHVAPRPLGPPPGVGAREADTLRWLGARLEQLCDALFYTASLRYRDLYAAIERQPEPLSLMLWDLRAPLDAFTFPPDWEQVAAGMVARFGARAEPTLVRVVGAKPGPMLPAVLPVDAAGIAPIAARGLGKLRAVREPAMAWLRAHRRTALLRLVPDAVGRPGPARDAAEHALRWLAADAADGRAALDAAVDDYAAAEPLAREAVAQVLGRDPLSRVPAKVARPPAWVVPAAMVRPRLREGGGEGGGEGAALPDEAVLAICEMLSFSTPDAVYAGVGVLKDACTPGSLGAFAWDLFAVWLAAGAPAKDGWAMRALGWLGDDAAARRLTPLIRRWPGESAHARAVTGLDVLADIGSDVALVNLNGIAEKLKFKGLQEKAREKVAAIAEARELTPDELADRLAPDLDLDARGGLDLDFGPRRFRAGFDELLRPVVKDEAGKRLKDLPKPVRTDDAERAAEAAARWGALKKDARAVAGLQLVRLEAMLATGRRVRPEAFSAFFAAHPLLRNLVGRLVWGVYADAAPASAPSLTFRVTEEGDYTDAGDAPVALDLSAEAAGLIGLVHPLQVGAAALERWGALFGDYEIAQPFPQLGRDTYALTEDEKAGTSLTRFEGCRVPSKRVRGLAARGWSVGTLADHGVAGCLERRVALADGRAALAVLDLDGGLWAGAPEHEPEEQVLQAIALRPLDAANARVAFGALDPLAASEMLRGPSSLVAASPA